MAEVVQKTIDDQSKQVLAERNPEARPSAGSEASRGKGSERHHGRRRRFLPLLAFEIIPTFELKDAPASSSPRMWSKSRDAQVGETLASFTAQYKSWEPKDGNQPGRQGDHRFLVGKVDLSLTAAPPRMCR
jgi:FKBP-type peptidyl-prolyl cis-trans isomerase (trigger factor)